MTRLGDGERGTTMVELVIAASLLVIVLGFMLPAVVTAHAAANRVVAEGRLHADGRAVLHETLRMLRSARPPAVCVDPAGAAVARCLRLGARQAAVLQATDRRVCFAASRQGAAPLAAPDLVCLGADPAGTVTVTTFGPTTTDDCEAGPPVPTSYTTPCWDHAAGRAVPVGRLAGPPGPLFRFEDAGARPLGAPGPSTLDATTDDAVLAATCPPAGTSCLAAELARIAAVRVDLRLGYRSGRHERTFDVRVTVVPRGSRYAREQSWTGG